VRKTILAAVVVTTYGGLAAAWTCGAESAGKAFLDSQTIQDRWKANYTGFKSMRIRVSTTLLPAEGPGSSGIERCSYLDRIQDGQCFLVRYTHTDGSAADIDSNNLGVMSFDGVLWKQYEPWSGKATIFRTSPTYIVPDAGNPAHGLMLSGTVQPDYIITGKGLPPDDPMRRLVERCSREYPDGVPGLVFNFMICQESGWLRVLPDLETVNGMPCHVVEMGDGKIWVHQYWLSHEKGMLPVKWTTQRKGGDSSRDEVLDVASVTSRRGELWYPRVLIRESVSNGCVTRTKYVVHEFAPDIEIPVETFEVNYPDGVRVTDTVGNKSFVRDRSLALVYDEAKGEFQQVPHEAAGPRK
jgi:hypothetical protein